MRSVRAFGPRFPKSIFLGFLCSMDHCVAVVVVFFVVIVVVVVSFFFFVWWFKICSLIFLRSSNIFLDLCPWL